MFSYPFAGWMGKNFPTHHFFYSSLVGSLLLIGVYLALAPRPEAFLADGLWHEHVHTHDEHHQHSHS